MQLLNFLICAAVGISIGVRADLTSYNGDFPQCGLQCLLETIPQSGCGLTNQTCICTNQKLAAATNLCVTQNCMVIEALSVANISMRSCDVPIVSRQNHLISTVGLGAVAFIAVVVRLVTRWRLEQGFKADDYMMIAVLIFYIDEFFYLAILGLSKISILMFYLRIFPSQNFRIACYIVVALVTTFTILFELLTTFQCLPVSYNWEGWKGDYGSRHRCSNLNTQTYSSSIINIAQDFTVLILPIPSLLKLNISLKKKINVIIMFSLGIFICITSIVRLTKLVQFRATSNPTWDYVDTTYWTAVETYISIIFPSLPAIRSLLSYQFPKLFGRETRNESGNSKNNYERSQTRSGGPSIRMSSKVHSANTNQDPVHGDDEAYFVNSKLELGDKVKGSVYTGVVAGRENSEDKLVRDEEAIYVSTEMKVEEREQNLNWQRT